MATDKEVLQLKVNLKGLSRKRFLILRDRYGLENDTELVRLLISQEYQRQFGDV